MDERIIVIDDDFDFLELMRARLIGAGFKHVAIEDQPQEAATRFVAEEVFDIALIDLTMPEMDGMQLLDTIKQHSPLTECIMVTAVNDARTAVQCIRKGAYDYLVKPVSEEDLAFSLKRLLEKKRLQELLDLSRRRTPPALRHPEVFKAIITRSAEMLRLFKEAELHAASDVPVLITGASGSGKELLALAMHAASARARYPFMPVNMAAISPGLFESEFFGHIRGAFTGAEKERLGLLGNANHGTLFLDEIGNMPLEMQGKLLRVLQDGEYSRVGTSDPQKVDVRVIAATNEDLEAMMRRNQFRKDLYYRIRGGWLHLPPLKERAEDIPLLVDYFLKEYCVADRRCEIDDAAMCLLLAYDFPGNIRELRSMIQSAVNLAQGTKITPACLPAQLRQRAALNDCQPSPVPIAIRTMAEVEKDHILTVYRQLNQNKSQTARQLGIGLNTLRRKLNVYNIA